MGELEVQVRAVRDADRPTVEWLTTELWGAAEVVVHASAFRPAELPGFIAERSGRIAGLLTYDVRGVQLEIVTLNALERRGGIGTQLIDAAREEAHRLGCREVMLTTTNDNVDALRFYQRRGFRLATLRPGAVDMARRSKPQIPRTGSYGIPLRDEIDLSCPVLPLTQVIRDPLRVHVLGTGRDHHEFHPPYWLVRCPDHAQCAIQGRRMSEGARCCQTIGSSRPHGTRQAG